MVAIVQVRLRDPEPLLHEAEGRVACMLLVPHELHVAIAGLDKVSHFLRRLRINDPTEARWLAAGHAHHSSMVRDHADLDSTNTTMARDHLLRIVSLKLVEMTIVE